MSETFFCDIEKKGAAEKIIDQIRGFSEAKELQTYIIKQPLGEKSKYNYEYDNAAIILIPGYKILVLNYGQECDEFEDFVEDLEEDIGHLSDRFEYKKVLGRPREWKKLVEAREYREFSIDEYNELEVDGQNGRKIDLLISLLIGSINDIEKVGVEYPETLLDKVKHKIVLFDGMQSRFIYEPISEKMIRIQGLAGTGKTELLLHKLRKSYVENKDSRIVFTCYNKVLAENMKARIPQFFNFMKVDEQIEWWTRLWVFPSWGSQNAPLTGLYSYICREYHLDFQRYSKSNSFDQVCSDAIDQLKEKDSYEPCFDYVYIDESQDFPESFFDLCALVTKEQLFIAGDIFQNVFDANVKPAIDCHYLLNKCYRTDSHTLMLAHSIGMGLFEQPVVRWLDDEEWNACGYNIKRKGEEVVLEREKIRRFDDKDIELLHSIQITPCTEYIEEILNCVDKIRENNKTVRPDDIAVVFLSNSKLNYSLADSLMYDLKERYDWSSCQGYVTKSKKKDNVFISNVNNIKGLEFPFIICVCTEHITTSIKQRNSIYMILTRSFLNSYLLINSENTDFIDCYQRAINIIERHNSIVVREPSETEKEQQAEKIRIEINGYGKSVEDIIDQVCLEYPDMSQKNKNILYNTIPNMIEDGSEEDVIAKTRGLIKLMLGDEQ